MSAILTNEGEQDALNNLIAGYFATVKIGLYTARAVYSKATVLADITAATFSGYASQTPAWVNMGIDVNGKAEESAPALVFTHNGGGTGNTVIGYYLWNTATGKLLYLEDFGAPVVINTNAQHIDVKPDQFCGDLTSPY